MKALIQDKYNLRYFIPLCVFLLTCLIFLSSGFISKATKPVITTPIGRTLSSQQTPDKVDFERAEFYKKSNLLVTSFYINSPNVIPNGELKVEVFNGRDSKKLEGKLEKINDSYYVLFIPNIASNFKQIINSLTLISSQEQELKFGSIAVTQKNVSVKDEEYQTQKIQYYEAQYKEYALQNIKQELKELDKTIDEFNQKIKAFNSANQELLLAMKYKTGDQQKEIQQKNNGNNSSIEGVKMQIQTVEKSKAQLQEQVKLLKEK